MKKILFAILFSALSAFAFAQAQATSTSKFAFDQAALQLSDAQGYTYKYYPDGASTGTILANTTCSGTTSPFQCQAPIPVFTQGSHTVTFSSTNIAGESAKSTPLSFVYVANPPVIPANPRIIP